MDDERIWGSEEGLWTGDAENYHRTIDAECLMVLPAKPFIVDGRAVEGCGLLHAALDQGGVDRAPGGRPPQEGLIVIAYKANAERDGAQPYEAYCTTVYRMIEHGTWRVVQHQQTPPLMATP